MKFAAYTSNKATRICRYLSSPWREDQCLEIIIHDGFRNEELTDLCNTNNVELICIDYEKLGLNGRERNECISKTLLNHLISNHIEYCFCFGGLILVGDLLKDYSKRIINFHPSLLPSFPGTKSIDHAIDYGVLFYGNTAHFVDEGVDTGPIIMQSILPRNEFQNYDSVLDLQVPMLIQIIKWLEHDRIIYEGRNVHVRDASFELDRFLPNLDPAYPSDPGKGDLLPVPVKRGGFPGRAGR